MQSKFNRFFILYILILGLSACGGGGGGGGGPVSIPKEVTFTPPTHYTDGSLLTDLTSYRLYYGPDANSLSPVFDIDSEGSTISAQTLTSAQRDQLESLLSENSTHFFALTAVNSQNIESSFSNIVEF